MLGSIARRAPLLVAAALIVAALFAPWTHPGDNVFFFGALDRVDEAVDELRRTGWEALGVLDLVLAALAAALVAVAFRRRAAKMLAALCTLAAVAVLVQGLVIEPAGAKLETGGRTVSVSTAEPVLTGPLLALAGLGLAVLALVAPARRRRRTTL